MGGYGGIVKSLPPHAEQRPHSRVYHGDTFIDHYEWLRDKDSPDVIAHLEAENAYTAQELAHLEPLRETLFEEIRSRTQETDMSVPTRRGNWWYFTRTRAGAQYGIYCRVPINSPDDWTPPEVSPDTVLPAEQIVLDANVEAEGHDFFSLGSFDLSADGMLLAYAIDTVGDERYLLKLRDLGTGEDLADRIPSTAAGAVLTPAGTHVFYTTVDESWRPDTVWRHRVGETPDQDVAVHVEPDERFWVGVDRTRSHRFLLIEIGSKITSEIHLLDTADPEGTFDVVWHRAEGVDYSVEHAVLDGSDRLLITHNRDSVNFDLIDVPLSEPRDRGQERVLFASDETTRVEGVDAFANHLVVSYRREGLTRIALADASSRTSVTEVEFDEPLFTVGVSGNPDWNQPTVRISYTSLITPAQVIDITVETGQQIVRKEQPVLGGYNRHDYVQWREWAVADDGTRVPVSLVRRADAPTSNAPVLLYGYGSYEISIDPGFSLSRLSLLDRGVTFAIAHVRGGGELGRPWYENGRRLQKANTFTDFVACAQHLVRSGVTDPAHLVIQGGSAGGLLVGAAMNLAPELFAGVLAQVPFVDALTSILDPELPLTVIEWDEWGDPLHDPDVYRYMRSYSPYENVRDAVAYPRILATTSLNDTRVLYVEPAKWVARLREVGAPALLKTEMSAGHGGVSGRYERWRETAFEYAWILDVLARAE